MVDSTILKATSYLEEIFQGNGQSEFEGLILQGLELMSGKESYAAEDGTWNAGAIMTVMDLIGAVAVFSAGDGFHSSVDLNSSFCSTAKIQEKVEIEARVNGINGRLKSAVIEIRRETSGEIIATGRLWMAPLSIKAIDIASSLSKL